MQNPLLFINKYIKVFFKKTEQGGFNLQVQHPQS